MFLTILDVFVEVRTLEVVLLEQLRKENRVTVHDIDICLQNLLLKNGAFLLHLLHYRCFHFGFFGDFLGVSSVGVIFTRYRYIYFKKSHDLDHSLQHRDTVLELTKTSKRLTSLGEACM